MFVLWIDWCFTKLFVPSTISLMHSSPYQAAKEHLAMLYSHAVYLNDVSVLLNLDFLV